MRTIVNRNFALVAISAMALGVPNVTVSGQTPAERPQFPAPKPEVQPPAVEANLKTFDVLDFDVFSNQKWDRLQERSEEHTSELQSLAYLVCRLLLEKKKKKTTRPCDAMQQSR